MSLVLAVSSSSGAWHWGQVLLRNGEDRTIPPQNHWAAGRQILGSLYASGPEETPLTDVLNIVLLPNSPKQLKLAPQIELLCNPCLRSPSIGGVGGTRGFDPGSKRVKHTENSSYEGSRPQKLACKWACVILAMNCAALWIHVSLCVMWIQLYRMLAKAISIDMVIDKGKLIKTRYIVKLWLCYIRLIIITTMYMNCLPS